MKRLIIVALAVSLFSGIAYGQPIPGQSGMQGPTRTQQAVINSQLVNINTATIEQLMTIKGVGPTTAQNIIDYRTTNGPFRVVEDLDKVKGIGPMKLEGMKPFIIVQ